MTMEALRAAREANPFQPFSLHLADGRSLRIPHRDYLSLAPTGRTVIVYHAGEAFSIVDVYLVTEIRMEQGTAATAGDA